MPAQERKFNFPGLDWRQRSVLRFDLTKSVFNVLLQSSIPKQNRRLVYSNSNSKRKVERSVGELTSAKRLSQHLV
jgi:hypothetical protein